MGKGFYTVMLAQFFSALADNALLICAIAILHMKGQAQDASLLKTLFALSYVLLAAFVGALADAMHKWKVMFISNSIKIIGCGLLYFGSPPLLAYAVVGLGAAIYSPAKYGIVTELVPHSKLVVANSWIEGLTVTAIILGTLLGGRLIAPNFIDWLLGPAIFDGIEHILGSYIQIAIIIVGIFYFIAAIYNLYIPETDAQLKKFHKNPVHLLKEFWECNRLLWKDGLGQVSLAVTTLFWGVGATLQFIVIDWADKVMGLRLEQSTLLQGIVAVGVTVGAVAAARAVTLKQSIKVIPLGIVMGLLIPLMVLVPFIPSYQLGSFEFAVKADTVTMVITLRILAIMILMLAVGAVSGLFLVPMNALLQHRGHMLMGAGHSIAVQNFNEHISILLMTAMYFVMMKLNMGMNTVVVIFGVFIAACMYLIRARFLANRGNDDAINKLPS